MKFISEFLGNLFYRRIIFQFTHNSFPHKMLFLIKNKLEPED